MSDIVPLFSSYSQTKKASLISSLDKINNKILLQIYGKELKNDPDAQNYLLEIIKSSATDQSLSNLS